MVEIGYRNDLMKLDMASIFSYAKAVRIKPRLDEVVKNNGNILLINLINRQMRFFIRFH